VQPIPDLVVAYYASEDCMTVEIKPLEDQEQIKSIILEPTVYKLNQGEQCLVEEFTIDPSCRYLSIQYFNELAGLFQFKEFNKIMLEAHISILPKYHNGHLSVKAVKAAKEYLAENTGFLKAFTTVPMECEHVHKLMVKTDFEVNGLIPNSIIYNNRLQDLIIYSLNIRG
jgi:RimJ/RimL family protein N-acetyltransferase